MRKLTSKALNELFEAVPLPIVLLNCDDNTALLCNDLFLELTGHTRETLPGKSVFQNRAPQHDFYIFFEMFNKKRIQQKGPINLTTVGNGSIIVMVTVELVEYKRKKCAIVSCYHDSKKQKYQDILEKLVVERNEALEQNEIRLSAAINATGGGIYDVTLPKGTSCFFSERWFEIFGLPVMSNTECHEIEKKMVEMIHPEDRVVFKEAQEAFINGTSKTFSIEKRVKKSSGEWIYVQDMAYAASRDENGHVRRMVGVILDITERKKLEEQLLYSQKMESLGLMAGGIAHDFNNMLQVITACSYRMMKHIEPDSHLCKDIEIIREAAQSSARLSHRLLSFSSKQLLQPQLISINQIVTRGYKLLSNSLRENIRVTLNLDKNIGQVFIDPVQFETIIVNMVINAQNAISGSGQIEITSSDVTLPDIHSHKRDVVPPGHYVMLVISDTGCGMEPAVKERIFDPFFTTRPNEGGSGLGLSSAYGIIKQSKGVIRVYSTPRMGTTFKIYLPCSNNQQVSVKRPEAIDHNTTVLVVDDNPYALSFVVDGLKELGCNVLQASTGQKAIEVSRSFKGEIQVLITDIVMPGLSGVEVEKIIRRERLTIRVLYISGFPAGKISNYCDPSKDVVLLSKPFTIEDLKNALLRSCSILSNDNEKKTHYSIQKQELSKEKDPVNQRILIVDDENVSAECLAFIIKKYGYAVEIADDGQSALELVESFKPHVIIMDIRLPDMDGYELARKIRELQHCNEITIIGCSGCSPVEDKINLFDEYLIKPLDIMALMQILAGYVLAV
ncbi:MAG TPA: response regulator [Chitinispirillaceae bacterium]|nr:response regulator [Chitinispirillaceae bacterium]